MIKADMGICSFLNTNLPYNPICHHVAIASATSCLSFRLTSENFPTQEMVFCFIIAQYSTLNDYSNFWDFSGFALETTNVPHGTTTMRVFRILTSSCQPILFVNVST